MDKQKGVKRLNIFSVEGRAILRQIVQFREEASSTTLLSDHVIHNDVINKDRTQLGDSRHCLSCNVTFSSREEQVEHYKLDWHRHNLKRKLRNLNKISQDEFEDQSVIGDMSSISGTDSSDESDDNEVGVVSSGTIQGTPLLIFNTTDNINHAIYRCLLLNAKEQRQANRVDVDENLVKLATPPTIWVILMRSGGHFAGAVFKDSTVLEHKTFHRYTVRAKQGTMQSSRDSHHGGHKPKSAGAALRRYNEAALEQEISDLVLSWKRYIDEASLIFVRFPKHTRLCFMCGKDIVIGPDDPRLRSIPFMTRRPTFSEIKSTHLKLSTIYSGVTLPQSHTHATGQFHTHTTGQSHTHTTGQSQPHTTGQSHTHATGQSQSHTIEQPHTHSDNSIDTVIDKVNNWNISNGSSSGSEQEVGVASSKSTKKEKKQKKTKSPDESERSVDPVIKQLHELINAGDVGGVKQLLIDIGNKSDDTDQSNDTARKHFPGINQLYHNYTALHIASLSGHSDIVYTLLCNGADPTIKACGKVPYLLSKDRHTRDSFRRFKGHFPDAYDYTTSLIPAPLTEEMEESRRGKKSEKKKAQKKAQKERKKEKAAQEELVSIEKQRENVITGLSDREKRALAAENRLMSNMTTPMTTDIAKHGVCEWCGKSLFGVVAFERLGYKYCQMDCVKEHRKHLQTNQ